VFPSIGEIRIARLWDMRFLLSFSAADGLAAAFTFCEAPLRTADISAAFRAARRAP
jgi:hypothetical protein